MAFAVPYTAFILPSGPEMIVILVVGIMLFGRRLPEVGRTIGQTVVKLRRGLNKLKNEMDLDTSVRDVKDAFRETRDDFTRDVNLPRLRDPGKVFEDLTDETLSSIVPPDVFDDVPDSLFSTNGEGPEADGSAGLGELGETSDGATKPVAGSSNS
jgi:TatA/E family protein of Tat protein translocase